jgi:hypothetical protein
MELAMAQEVREKPRKPRSLDGMEIRHAHEKIAIKNCYTGNALQGMHYDEIAKNDLAGFHVTEKKGRREIHRTKYVL